MTNKWFKLLDTIKYKAKILEDRAVMSMIEEMEEIPGYIRNMALMYYMRKCRELYLLAYM